MTRINWFLLGEPLQEAGFANVSVVPTRAYDTLVSSTKPVNAPVYQGWPTP
jgi:hypothetical protein